MRNQISGQLSQLKNRFDPVFDCLKLPMKRRRSGRRAGVLEFISLEEADRTLAELPRPVVHLKGFASGLLLRNAKDPPVATFNVADVRAETQRGVERLLTEFDALGAATLAWDGDVLQADSFAMLVPLLAARRPELRLVAFKYADGRAWFESAWEKSGLDVTVVLVPPALSPAPATLHLDAEAEPDYAALGCEGFRLTRAEVAICFGGGGVVATEFERTRSLHPPPRFIHVPVPRCKRVADAWRLEMPALLGVEGVALLGVDGAGVES